MQQTSPRWVQRPEGSNWGDFGPEDQLGRMNLITPERRRAALAEAKEGLCFSLGLPLDLPGGTALTGGLRQPPRLFASEMHGNACYNLIAGSEDSHDITCDDGATLYSQYSSQWDSLAHWGGLFDADGDGTAERVYYNGFRAGVDVVSPAEGGPRAKALGMENLAAHGAQGRGVLVDLTAHSGAVGYDTLMRELDLQGAEVRAGDFFCLHTGVDEMLLAMGGSPDPEKIGAAAALDGRDKRLLQWIDHSGIAAICADNLAVETLESFFVPCGHGSSMLPIHELCLFKLGIHLGELWHMAELKRWLRVNGRSAFLLTAPPWKLPGSVGSPVNPVATV